MTKWFKWLSVQLALLIFLFFIAEIIFRAIGYQPGDISPGWYNFKPVDSLVVEDVFFVNDKGIFVANRERFIEMDVYVNSEGFRTPGFDAPDTSALKLMLIGDSFTWGMSSEPWDSSFADRLRNMSEWEIINLGIPAADPVQYKLVAEEYVPRLKPELVLLFFFMGNDLMSNDRIPDTDNPFCFYTNAGAIFSEIDGIRFHSPEEAYNYLVNEKFYLGTPSNLPEKIAAQSGMLSRLYSLKFRIVEKMEYENLLNDLSLTKSYLYDIADICRQHNSSLFIFVIPEVKEANMRIERYKKRYSDLFEDDRLKQYLYLPQTKKNWFNNYPDAHLNNRGHREYAEYVFKIISEQIKE